MTFAELEALKRKERAFQSQIYGFFPPPQEPEANEHRMLHKQRIEYLLLQQRMAAEREMSPIINMSDLTVTAADLENEKTWVEQLPTAQEFMA